MSQSGSGAAPLVLTNIKAPKNGYAYIYVSNESDEMVYFDNLQVSQNHGRILEENHYYAYGLRIAGISSRKLTDTREGHAGNFNLYNDKELFEEADLDWYDYGFRNYDPQIGRFPQLDPLTDEYPFLTPYQYASCDPITNIDLDGLEGVKSTIDFTYQIGQSATGLVLPTLKTTTSAAGNASSVISIASMGLDGINTGLNLSLKRSQSPPSQPTIKPISEREMKGYNWWHDAKQFNPNFKIVDAIVNRVSRTFQQLTHNITGQQAIYNLDGTKASDADSRSQADVKMRLFDFLSTSMTFGGPLFGGLRSVQGAKTFFEGAKYSDKVLRQMSSADDIYHAFPTSVDGYAIKFGQWTKKVGGDGKVYEWLTLGGTYGGREGTFEYIKDANGIINHRYFNIFNIPYLHKMGNVLNFLSFLKAKGRPVSETNPGNDQLAISVHDALMAIDLLKDSEVSILGGDIFTENNDKSIVYAYQLWGSEYHYLNWYCDKRDTENEKEFLERSYEVAKEAILHANEVSERLNRKCLIAFVI